MAEPADMKADIAAAIEEVEFDTDETEAQRSWDDWDAETDAEEAAPAAAEPQEPSKEEDPDVDAQAEAEVPAEEPPSEYWGTSLEGIPAEQRAEILAKLQQQDSYIQSLQARLAKEPEPVPTPEPVADEDITDEALLVALGFDPEDYETQTLAPKILPLARTVLSLEDKVDAITNEAQAQKVEVAWNAELDELEGTYGKLPGQRIDVLRYAIEEGVSSPAEVYFKLHAPGKREVDAVVSEARRAAAKKAEAGGVRPSSAAASVGSKVTKDMSLRDAVAQSMREAEKDTGVRWKDIFGRSKKAAAG